MRSGRLRHRLDLQQLTETRGSMGGITKSFTTQDTVWGAIEPVSGKEYLATDQTQNETMVRIVIRYHATIDETWRVLNDSIAYSIVAVLNENNRDRMLTLMCRQGVKEAGNIPANVVNSGTNVVNSGTQVVYSS